MLISALTNARSLLAMTLLMVAPFAWGQRQAAETELKAAIFANMLLFVDWPAQGAQSPQRLRLCYLDVSPLSVALARLDGTLLKGKPLQVLRVDAAQVGSCHALYVSPSDSADVPRVAAVALASGVFLMGDAPGNLQRGVMLNLELDRGRVVFDIDLRSARQAGLAVSSKALRLARQVQE